MSDVLAITLLRHGRSLADDEGVHEGRYDAPLTERGRAQVQARAADWQAKGLRFDQVIASPLRRAAETAQIVAAALAAPLTTDADWQERHCGAITGMPFAEAKRLYPKPALRNTYTPYTESGESDWELYVRAAQALERVVRRGPGRYLVVAHGGILNAAMHSIFGITPPINQHGCFVAFADTGYVHLTYRPALHQWVLRELGGAVNA